MKIRKTSLCVLFLWCIATPVFSQQLAGASYRMLLDGTSSSGVTAEYASRSSAGWIGVQMGAMNRKYEQTFPGSIIEISRGTAIGDGEVRFASETTLFGRTYPPGSYEAKTSTVYIPYGTQVLLSGSYAYDIVDWLSIGAVIGIEIEHDVPVATAEMLAADGSHQTLYGIIRPPDSDYNPSTGLYIVGTPTHTTISPNVGGCLRVRLNRPVLLLEYATQTGLGIGLGISF